MAYQTTLDCAPTAVSADAQGASPAHLVARLQALEHQLKDLQAMISTDLPCHDIARQMSSIRKAMNQAFYALVLQQMVQAKRASRIDQIRRMEITRSAHLLDRFG